MKLSTANHIFALTMTALLWASGLNAAPNDEPLTGLAYSKERPVVYEDAWDLWPYVFLDDNGTPCGYNVDLLDMIFKELNIPYVVRLKPARQALEDLRNGQSDLMLGMVAKFHDDYTRYYGKNIIHLFTHSIAHPETETQTIQNINDLEKYKVIVHEGSFSHHLMQDRGWGDNAIPYVEMDKAIQQVSIEGHGQVLWNTMSLKWLINRYHTTNLTLSPVDMPSGDYRFMANDSLLLQLVDNTYAFLKATEKLQPLEMKWFYPEEVNNDDSPQWLWYMAAAIGLIAMILGIATLAYYIRERQVTRDSRIRNARLALVLKTCQVKIWTYDVERRMITWYGDDARQEKNTSLEHFAKRYEPQEFEKLRKAVRQLLAKQEEEVKLEISVIDSNDDKLHMYSVALKVLQMEKGEPSVIIGTKRDITEEQELQQHSDETKKRYQAVFNNAMVDMMYYDSNGFVANMNERAQQTFGMTTEEARQKHINVTATLDTSTDTMEYCHLTQFLTPNGENQGHANWNFKKAMCYELQLVPMFDNKKKMLGVYATGRNVTEIAETYRKAQGGVEQLKLAMKELTDYVSNINYAMDVGGVRMMNYSPDTHMLTINHRMHEAQYVLTQQRCLDLVDAQSIRPAMRLFRSMDRRQNISLVSEIKTSLRIKGDRRVCLLVQFFPNIDDNGQITGYNGICRDTTEIKHTEMMLQRETEKAQEVEQLKNKFLHNMCYEIRTPLDNVVANAEKFEQDHTLEEEKLYIDSIKENSAYLLNLINDILFLSRLDAKMVEFKPMQFDFSKTFESHCTAGWENCKQEGVEYTVENHYEQLVVIIDETNIGRIIEQVTRNAAEHTTSGFVRARYEYIGGKLLVVVDDTGTGIESDMMEHIFERFNAKTGKSHRTGLGLPICKELATQMNGTIDVESTVGKGTTVWLSIPCEAIVTERRKNI